MRLVNRAKIGFIFGQCEKFGARLLSAPVQAVNFKGLRYVPERLSSDIVEILPKAIKGSKKRIAHETLEALANKGLSLNEMASELGISTRSLRVRLKKGNIVTDAQKEFRILKEYFTATTTEGRAKAFGQIDKYLEQIAKQEAKLRKGVLYEDCLQDVRLRFFELVEQNRKEGIFFPVSVLRATKTSGPSVQKEIETISLGRLGKISADLSVGDSRVENFEVTDFAKFFLKHLRKCAQSFSNLKSEYRLVPRDIIILEKYLKEGKSTAEIAKFFGMTKERVRVLLKYALKNSTIQFEKLTSNEFLQQRAKLGQLINIDYQL